MSEVLSKAFRGEHYLDSTTKISSKSTIAVPSFLAPPVLIESNFSTHPQMGERQDDYGVGTVGAPAYSRHPPPRDG